jgi:hypothetical protein
MMNLTKASAPLLIGLSLAAAGCAARPNPLGRRASAEAETIASYPPGAFLENLSTGPAGDLTFTSYMDRTLYRWSGSGAPAALARLPEHPVGVLVRRDDIIVSAHGTSFTEGPGFTATNRMLVLSAAGEMRRSVAAPDARFLNGLVELAPEVVLVADSLAGRIWAFDPRTGALSSWFADPQLAPDPAQAVQRPGANGLKVHDGALYISNSSRGEIYRLRLNGTQPAGSLQVAYRPGPVDDFTFLRDGSIVGTTHGDKLIRISPKGVVSELMGDGCDGCTSVAEYGPARDLIVLTTGKLMEGGGLPARVLRLRSPIAPQRLRRTFL